MLVIDGVKYRLWTPKDEEKEFHPMIKEHSKEIFGENSLYFDVKHKLKSKSGIGSIPDAYVITLSKPYQWYVVESELASHPVYDHIVRQLTKFINGIKNQSTRNQILDTFYDEIRNDKLLGAYVEKAIGSQEIHHFLSKLLSKPPRMRARIWISAGTVYSTMYSLEREGLIEASLVAEKGRGRVYTLSDKGRKIVRVILGANVHIQSFLSSFTDAR